MLGRRLAVCGLSRPRGAVGRIFQSGRTALAGKDKTLAHSDKPCAGLFFIGFGYRRPDEPAVAGPVTYRKKMDQGPTLQRCLSVLWLVMWRGALGGFVLGGVAGFVSALLTGGPGLSGLAGGAAGLVWSFFVIRMALRKEYRDFRIVFVRTQDLSAESLDSQSSSRPSVAAA